MLTRFIPKPLIVFCFLAAAVGSVAAAPLQHEKPALQTTAAGEEDRNQRLQKMLATAVRHELVSLPNYDVFDWLEAELLNDGTVILRGEVVRPTTANDAENRIRKIETATGVINRVGHRFVFLHHGRVRTT